MSTPKDAISHIVPESIKHYLAILGGDPEQLVLDMEAHARQHSFPLIGRQSGRWLELLSRMIGARRVFEFGSGYGYSAYWFARAVGPQGRVIGTEKDAHELEAHARMWKDHPLKSRVDLRQGDAFEILDSTDGEFDVVFIDIHKKGYPEALERGLPRLRTGGLVLADNTLWGGRVTQRPRPDDEGTLALRAFNQQIHEHPQLQTCILPTGDGLSVSLKVD